MGNEPTGDDREPPSRKPWAPEPEGFDAKAFAQDHVWTFAKTMSHIPHEYVVRGKDGCTSEDWDRMAAYVRKNGCWAAWSPPGARWRRTNIYLELGDHRYWVIYPVINRERAEDDATIPLSRAEAEEMTKRTKSVQAEIWGHRDAW